MSKEAIALLQHSLAENERVRQRQLRAFAVLFVALVAILFWLGHLGSKPGADLREMVVWLAIAMVFAITYGMMALAIYINRSMGRLLRVLKMVSEKS
jgi:DMSO reductase anchor subunit